MLTKLREEDPFLRLSQKNTSASFRSSFVTLNDSCCFLPSAFSSNTSAGLRRTPFCNGFSLVLCEMGNVDSVS